ncbi:phage tail protein [Paraburkholderia sp. BCC1884]|uniref:phage tail protein n=1 Tax=Paraburkholderia sp. BCC1884 TaxID=2562668 RepID=UPI001C9087B0|nr:tail fiber protein [Paraburkholderia sp. BCC1884]
MSDPYLGEIRMVAFDFAPYGWALCQGQLLPLSQNQALFTLLGTSYGGNGTQTFGLPNLAGRSPVGTSTGGGLTPIVTGQFSGLEQFTMTAAQLPTHTHPAALPATTLTASVSVPASTAATGGVEAQGPRHGARRSRRRRTGRHDVQPRHAGHVAQAVQRHRAVSADNGADRLGRLRFAGAVA